MIWLDVPLLIVSVLFLGLGFIYGWGLLRWFRQDFRWSYAAVVGILSVVCTTAAFVWFPRYGYALTTELVISLFFPFSTALAGMLWVDRELKRDRVEQQNKLEDLQKKLDEKWPKQKQLELEGLKEQVLEQGDLIAAVERIIDKQGQTHKAQIEELLAIFKMQGQANEIMNHLHRIN